MRVVDMHCDTIYKLPDYREAGEGWNLRENGGHLDLLRMKQSNYLLQNFAIYVNLVRFSNPWDRFLTLYQMYCEEMGQNSDLILPVYRYADIAANEKAGKMSSLLTIEEGAVCEGNLQKLHDVYEKGVRMITLTWNYANELGYPNYDSRKPVPAGTKVEADTVNGLTETGIMFVEEMEKLGIIPDVSHLSDAGFYDVAKYTKKPFVASHSNARAVCDGTRNMTDDMIRLLAEKGGVMGLNYQATFLTPRDAAGNRQPGTIEAIVKHAKHIVNVGGIDVLGLGSDFDGIATHEELQGAQGMEKLYDALIKAGFTSAETDKIFAENVLRVYKDTLG